MRQGSAKLWGTQQCSSHDRLLTYISIFVFCSISEGAPDMQHHESAAGRSQNLTDSIKQHSWCAVKSWSHPTAYSLSLKGRKCTANLPDMSLSALCEGVLASNASRVNARDRTRLKSMGYNTCSRLIADILPWDWVNCKSYLRLALMQHVSSRKWTNQGFEPQSDPMNRFEGFEREEPSQWLKSLTAKGREPLKQVCTMWHAAWWASCCTTMLGQCRRSHTLGQTSHPTSWRLTGNFREPIPHLIWWVLPVCSCHSTRADSPFPRGRSKRYPLTACLPLQAGQEVKPGNCSRLHAWHLYKVQHILL